MSRNNWDKYESYEALFDPMQNDRQARRKRKPKVKHTPKKAQHEIVAELAETTGLEGGFNTTYHPGLFEEGWLLQSLRDFYNMHHISDVLASVDVSGVLTSVETWMGLLAAAVMGYATIRIRRYRDDS